MGFNKPKGFDRKIKEARKSTRYPVEAEITITCGPFKLVSKSVDMSATGISLKKDLPLELKGKDLEVQVLYVTSDRKQLTAAGVGKMVSKALNRVEITDPEAALQELLDDIMGMG